ncbi:MAG TPA: PD-(D/E)XK nuclease family protein, partial [Anaerolineae bacterium]|nr:PD-(D/E)XK nuclease family protein [Anaerolineae bacterium]
MLLPVNFQFSQSNLQDFDACARRFKLRYLDQIRWPAVAVEPVQEAERLAQLGTDFHRLVQQHLAGIAETLLTDSLIENDADLQSWWRNYLQYHPSVAAETRLYAEVILSTPLAGRRLLARFDLLAAQPDGTFLIIDWKTSLRKPPRDRLAQRLQTRVYPYVLAMAGDAFNDGRAIDPATIQMIYWYPARPDQPESFAYNDQLRQQDEQFLSGLIERVKDAAQANHFPLVEDKRACAYCVYRSYCDRGTKAGALAALA